MTAVELPSGVTFEAAADGTVCVHAPTVVCFSASEWARIVGRVSLRGQQGEEKAAEAYDDALAVHTLR